LPARWRCSRQYRTPFLPVVCDNRGWKSPKLSALAVQEDGFASRGNEIGVTFDPSADYAGIAAATGGALGLTVKRPEEVEAASDAALKPVREEGRAAVPDVWLPHQSRRADRLCAAWDHLEFDASVESVREVVGAGADEIGLGADAVGDDVALQRGVVGREPGLHVVGA